MLESKFSLNGKLALVTGASSGIGAHLSKVLARAGARVAVAARRAERLQQLVSDIQTSGGQAFAVTVDVADANSVAAAFSIIAEQAGVVEVLINNAGVAGEPLSLEKSSPEDWDFVMNTNLRGAWFVAREVSQRLIATGKSGSIVNISSIYGLREGLFKLPYNVSKSAVAQLTKTMAAELSRKKYPIRVNALCPGYFATELNTEFLQSEYGRKYIDKSPPGRLGNLEELDAPLLLLASEAGSFINGALLPVDGGHAIQPI